MPYQNKARPQPDILVRNNGKSSPLGALQDIWSSPSWQITKIWRELAENSALNLQVLRLRSKSKLNLCLCGSYIERGLNEYLNGLQANSKSSSHKHKVLTGKCGSGWGRKEVFLSNGLLLLSDCEETFPKHCHHCYTLIGAAQFVFLTQCDCGTASLL